MRKLDDLVYNKCQEISDRYIRVTDMLSFEEVLADSKLTIRLQKEMVDLEEIYANFKAYKSLVSDIEFYKNYKDENNGHQQLEDELQSLEKKISNVSLGLERALIGLEKTNEIVVIEVYSTKKTDYVDVLYQAYINTSNNLGFEVNIDESVGSGNAKKFYVAGENCFSLFYGENGVHEFIRNNKSENVNVCVYRKPSTKLKLFKESDVRIEAYRSSGAGGQNINKVSTAIRAIHTPSGIVVTCQDERSQFQNKERALDNLRNKVNDAFKLQYDSEMKKEKASAIKLKCKNVRTYNIDKNSIFDVVLQSKYQLNEFLEGNLRDLFYNLAIRGKF